MPWAARASPAATGEGAAASSRTRAHVELGAAAIVAEVPFKLEIVQPTAPLVRDGQIDLKVVATRVGDFKAPISISMLYNPPGVASSASIAIPEGQNEAVIPVTANGGAAVMAL